jgi:hypothetical protein
VPEILPKAAVPIRGATLAARGCGIGIPLHRAIPEDVAISGKDIDLASEFGPSTTHPNFRDRWFGAKQRGRDAGSTIIEAAEVVKEAPS